MCIKCDETIRNLVILSLKEAAAVDARRKAMLNNTLDNVGEQAQEEHVNHINSVPRQFHTEVVEKLMARLSGANARANEAEMLALANRRWSEALNEQLQGLKQDRDVMHTEHENLMSAYKALLESHRLLILSLE